MGQTDSATCWVWPGQGSNFRSAVTDGNPPTWNEVVDRCATSLIPLAQSLVLLQGEIGLVPVDGSQYALDLQESADDGELKHQRTLDVGSILGAKAVVGYGHLYAIADVLRGPGVVLGPWTLLRSVVEGLSFGLWIMSGGSVDERIQRCMTERLHGIYENRKLGNDAGDGGDCPPCRSADRENQR